ncbi:MAG: hypothetical protein IT336_12515 [Thermomicrobiales bacterium]|nr:hypothetical protein [Thermomicrobiales bacterium]
MAIAPNGSLDPAAVNRTLEQASSLRRELRRLREQIADETFEDAKVETGLAAIDELIGDLGALLASLEDDE